MKAAVYWGPKRLEVQDIPDPQCGPDEVIVRVEACSVCGTDIRIYNHGQNNVRPPQVIGHEIAGTIAECGSNVRGYSRGQRVTVATPVGCGQCRYCRREMPNLCKDFKALGYHFPGGYAQYMPIPAAAVQQGSILLLPDSVTFEQAALVEPLSCVINGQEYVRIEKADSVAIFGAGAIGCMHAVLARAQGAGQIFLIGVSRERLDLARRFPIDAYWSILDGDPVARVLEATEGYGADVAICCCSDPEANRQALQVAAKRGRVSFFAGLPKSRPTIEFDCNRLHYAEISLFGAFASNLRQYREALAAIASGRVNPSPFITDRFPLEGLEQAIRQSETRKGLKMLSLPQL
ncbi:MAG: alcohol dehydrogenase catalytic domain-containing protein [Planctomycetes bacterium]|nr:alcohol dehydrogenase catalytic domain-containing protein [Planctomycetota bacterium]